jgi:hypothetical protein
MLTDGTLAMEIYAKAADFEHTVVWAYNARPSLLPAPTP